MKKNLYKYVLPFVLFILLYLIGKTLRAQIINREVEYQLGKKSRAIIYTFWHGRMLYFPYLYRFSGRAAILASPSEDGEIVARTAKIFGFSNIRGSSYKKSGFALLKLVRTIKEGNSVVLVGDGSRGPCHKIQKGILNLAYLTGAPILPVTYGAKNNIQLNSWDRFIVPLPFTRIKVMYANPVYVDKKEGKNYLQDKLEELETKLNKSTKAVDAWD